MFESVRKRIPSVQDFYHDIRERQDCFQVRPVGIDEYGGLFCFSLYLRDSSLSLFTPGGKLSCQQSRDSVKATLLLLVVGTVLDLGRRIGIGFRSLLQLFLELLGLFCLCTSVM